MSSARQLLYQKIEGSPSIIYTAYIENMRQLRVAPDYWRFVDHKAWVDGPPGISQGFTRRNIVWRAEVDSTDDTKVNLYNETDNAVGAVSFTLIHTESIVAVSLEFDQLGRPLLVYEDVLGNINLYWYNPVIGDTEQIVLTAGITPHICSTRYYKAGGSADSERLIFYVKPTTGTVHYRRQDDRYGVEYDVDNTVTDVLELVAASKNLYGGLTVVAARQNVDETVELISWTARQDVNNDDIIIGSDRDTFSVFGNLTGVSAGFTIFSISEGLVILTNNNDLMNMSGSAGTILNFSIADATNLIQSFGADSFGGLTGSTATLPATIQDVLVTLTSFGPDSFGNMTASAAALPGISIQAALITVTSFNPDVVGSLTGSSAILSGFTIG